MGANPVVLRADSSVQREYPATETETVEHHRCGRQFQCGIHLRMLKYGITRNDIDNGLSTEQWDKLMASAQLFSAECCKSIFNYVSPEFGKQMKASSMKMRNKIRNGLAL